MEKALNTYLLNERSGWKNMEYVWVPHATAKPQPDKSAESLRIRSSSLLLGSGCRVTKRAKEQLDMGV